MNRRSAILLLALLPVIGWAQELPDIATVPPDLTVPPMIEGSPAPGQRVRQTAVGWEKTEAYHALYLPTDWQAGRRYPIIVEWAGNGNYRNRFGDESTGRVEGSNLGYGLTAGRGCIWLCLPYLDATGTKNVITWWGDPPSYDPEPTLTYCRATIQGVCAQFGGDPDRVVLAGFSRGALAVNYLGLHDNDTARLWRAFICYSHYDGVKTWPYPASDRSSARKRLEQLHGRPQFICGEGANSAETQRYLEEIGALASGAFTIQSTGFRNHNDAWVLRPSPARDRLREWFWAAVK